MKMSEDIKIVLASKSPRRKTLLEEAGFQIQVITREVDESFPEDLPLDQVAEYLAIKKASAFDDLHFQDEFLVTADSVVIKDGVFFGKPVDKEDAYDMLYKLQGGIHQVYTGVCIQKGRKKVTFTSRTDVKFSSMSESEILYYIDRHQPYDKAGSYGIQDWIGLCKIDWMEGTFANVMGLPVNQVYAKIIEWDQNIEK